MSITEAAPAKINLCLDLLGRRPDGYHEICTVMQTVDWCDTVTMEHIDGNDIELTCDGGIPADETNTAFRAVCRYREASGCYDGWRIDIHKRVPDQAGLGGGSSDAAAVLRILNRYYEQRLTDEELGWVAAEVGADVPFFLQGGTCLATGTGTALTPLSPLPDCHFLIVKPQGGVSTPEAYRLIDTLPSGIHPPVGHMLEGLEAGDLDAIAGAVGNAFEQPLSLPFTQYLVARMRRHGALAAALSGCGSAVFGLFRDKSAACETAALLQERFPILQVCSPTACLS